MLEKGNLRACIKQIEGFTDDSVRAIAEESNVAAIVIGNIDIFSKHSFEVLILKEKSRNTGLYRITA